MKYFSEEAIRKAIFNGEHNLYTWDEIEEAMSKIPAADVQPVVKAHWEWNPDGMDWGIGAWCCSECKSKAETWWANDQKYNPLHCSGGHFCGNCGARMDGDGE